MMITQREIENKRLALLFEQSEINQTACAVCPRRIGRYNMPIEECGSCAALAQVKRIGEELCDLTVAQRQLREDAERFEKIFNKSLTRVTPTEYNLLRRAYTDQQIAKRYNVSLRDFREWKDIVVVQGL